MLAPLLDVILLNFGTKDQIFRGRLVNLARGGVVASTRPSRNAPRKQRRGGGKSDVAPAASAPRKKK